VQPVRELYGVQTAMQADRAMFVAIGSYTDDARRFGAQVGMTLVDGEELLRIISTGLGGEPLELPVPTAPVGPAWPACGGEMVLRTARRGPHAGEDFFGCARFPACRGTVALPGDVVSPF
jgi:restriction system protein